MYTKYIWLRDPINQAPNSHAHSLRIPKPGRKPRHCRWATKFSLRCCEGSPRRTHTYTHTVSPVTFACGVWDAFFTIIVRLRVGNHDMGIFPLIWRMWETASVCLPPLYFGWNSGTRATNNVRIFSIALAMYALEKSVREWRSEEADNFFRAGDKLAGNLIAQAVREGENRQTWTEFHQNPIINVTVYTFLIRKFWRHFIDLVILSLIGIDAVFAYCLRCREKLRGRAEYVCFCRYLSSPLILRSKKHAGYRNGGKDSVS